VPSASEICAAAMFGIIIGMKSGLMRSLPLVHSVWSWSSKVPKPPTPLATSAPMRSGSLATSSLESSCAMIAAASAYWAKGSMRRCVRLSMYSSGSNSRTSAAMRTGSDDASKLRMRPMPDWPAMSRDQRRSMSQPSGDTTPMPVMTTRRGVSVMRGLSCAAAGSLGPQMPSPPSTGSMHPVM